MDGWFFPSLGLFMLSTYTYNEVISIIIHRKREKINPTAPPDGFEDHTKTASSTTRRSVRTWRLLILIPLTGQRVQLNVKVTNKTLTFTHHSRSLKLRQSSHPDSA